MFEISSVEWRAGRLWQAEIYLQVDIDVEKEVPVYDNLGERSYRRYRLTAKAGTTYIILDTRMELRHTGDLLTFDQMDALAAFEQAWKLFDESDTVKDGATTTQLPA